MKIAGKALRFIQQAEQGTTLQEVGHHCRVERHTMTKYLESLRAKGLISFKKVGMAKLWFATKHPLIEVLKNKDIASGVKKMTSAKNVAIINKDFEVEWTNVDSPHKRCHIALGNATTMCSKCPAHKAFKTGKTQRATINGSKVEAHPLKDTKGNTISIVEVRE